MAARLAALATPGNAARLLVAALVPGGTLLVAAHAAYTRARRGAERS